MNIRNWAILVFLLCCLLRPVVSHAVEDQRPNIIFLLADDQNFSSIGAYGNPEVQTPNMDQLAADGMAFDRHYNTTAICWASRANAFTGMYEYKAGTNFSHGRMKRDIWQETYPVLLRKEGYLTAFAGKFGVEIEGFGKTGLPEQDFDIWGGGPGQTQYATAKNRSMAKYAKEFPHSTLSYGAFGKDVIREAVKQDRRFCLSISFKAPHRPTTPDPKFDHIYKGKKFTKPANYGREHASFSEQSKQGRQYERFESWDYDKNYDAVMATYYQQIYAIDVALGMIREELKKQGVADNTVIIYTSDNGFICGSHGYGSKVLPMEESSRAPLIIFDPRSTNAGKKLRCDELTANIDFAPTILELAGLKPLPNMDGKSLLPLLKDPKLEIHKQIAFINCWGSVPTKSLSIFTKQYKYTYWWYSDNSMEPSEDLFHIADDPLELRNIANMPGAEQFISDMRKRYDAQLKHWKQNCPHNSYQQYKTLFDRHVPPQTKQQMLRSKKRSGSP